MGISAKQAAITFILVLVVGTLLFLYTASRVIIFTKYFTSDIEVSRIDTAVSSDDVYATLNRMEEIRLHRNDCPDRLDRCPSRDGSIRVIDAPASGDKKRLKLSTEELTNFWTPPISPARHEAYVQGVVEAFRSEGYIAEEIIKQTQ